MLPLEEEEAEEEEEEEEEEKNTEWPPQVQLEGERTVKRLSREQSTNIFADSERCKLFTGLELHRGHDSILEQGGEEKVSKTKVSLFESESWCSTAWCPAGPLHLSSVTVHFTTHINTHYILTSWYELAKLTFSKCSECSTKN